MNPSVVAVLRCPVCQNPLTYSGSLRCPTGHSFDVARQGYVDLTAGRVRHHGDTSEMVAARQRLLAAGHLDAVTDVLAEAVGASATGVVLDAGAGTGHHLARLLDARPGLLGLAVDVAKPALRRAGRAHPRLAAVRADVWRRLPVAAGTISWIMNVFAPRSGAEFHRVLSDDGQLVVVTPNQDHLGELVAELGLLAVDPAKSDRLAATLGPWFDQVERRERTSVRLIGRAEAQALVGMGPSAWHTEHSAVAARLADLPEPLPVTVSVALTTWRPRRDSAPSDLDEPAADFPTQ